jgi:hypothetical protein
LSLCRGGREEVLYVMWRVPTLGGWNPAADSTRVELSSQVLEIIYENIMHSAKR